MRLLDENREFCLTTQFHFELAHRLEKEEIKKGELEAEAPGGLSYTIINL